RHPDAALQRDAELPRQARAHRLSPRRAPGPALRSPGGPGGAAPARATLARRAPAHRRRPLARRAHDARAPRAPREGRPARRRAVTAPRRALAEPVPRRSRGPLKTTDAAAASSSPRVILLLHLLQVLDVEMRVDLRRADGPVAEQLLYGAQIGAPVQ